MTAPPGAVVALTYDSRRDVAEGDAIVTGTGRTYLVVGVRRQQRGRFAGRWHLRCVVLAADAELDPDVVRHPLRWYRRERSR